jgi:hypothetical protein
MFIHRRPLSAVLAALATASILLLFDVLFR